VLVVPCGTEQAYGNAYGWQDFAEIISDCDGTFQSYFAQEITVWNAVGTYYDCPWENYMFRIAGDTVVDQQHYKKAEYSHIYWRGGYEEARVPEYDFLLREERSTGRLWGRYLDEEEDFLIADMTLCIGDTFYMRDAYGYDSILYTVQDTLTVDSRRTIVFNLQGYTGELVKFVEGIGCTHIDCLQTGFSLGGPLVCCHKDGELVYHQSVQGFPEDDCIIRAVGIEDVESDGIKVYSLGGRILVDGADGEEVHIFDMMGRTIHNEALPTGIYMVKVGNHPARKVAVIR
ncbi:MAG: T9SS type A sorting domain-containing protein, partial [Bacteroidales bacterium]|nr:T9SS type A sorting domain-containing protein [Bacteroidales bacterium]